MTSLRTRLFVGLTAVILSTGCVGAVFSYFWAFDEAIEMQDSVLIQIGGLLHNGSVNGDRTLRGVDAEAAIDVVELGTALPAGAEEGQLWSLPDGLHVTRFAGQTRRVLLGTRPNQGRFAVLQPTDVRDDIAGNVALRTLLPITALIPCLLLVTALVIARSLRPMVRLADDIDLRSADDMKPLPLVGAPSELRPFIASINGLLERMKSLLDRQRRFIADAAHELRTPITALGLQAENLAYLDLAEPARERLAALGEGMDRTKHLLEQLLALARQEADMACEAAVVSLDGIVKDLVANLLPKAERKGIDLGFELIEPVAVRGEPIMVTTMVRNLADNAVRFTPSGGRVDIRVHREGGEAVLQITDSGPGIPPADMERIFEPFFRGSRPTEDGTGLGLSIVRRIVHQLGGSIVLENICSPPFTGLRATARLPVGIVTSADELSCTQSILSITP